MIEKKESFILPRRGPELLLPVGEKAMALAAIHNGADAIFVGVPGFNARGRSYDFQWQELREIIQTCHLYGVKVNLAFNIVIFENELHEVVRTLSEIIPLRPDALIVQDLGLVRLIRQMAPDQVVHASTQMTVTNDLAIRFVDDLKIKRFVLGRENSLAEIQLIKKNTSKELEVFVHGALCVSYSGQCFTSESIGGRSANRGQCAQSCRFSYDLIVDGQKKNTLDRNYLVSPQDLCSIAEVPQLIDSGVACFKVEGRLKTPEYVASSAASYRRAIEGALNQRPLSESEIQKEKNWMAVNYSRGFFSGWMHGVNHQKLVDGTYSSHRGALIGEIKNYGEAFVDVQLSADVSLENGDGLLWVLAQSTAGSSSESSPRGQGPERRHSNEQGSFIFSIEKLKHNTYRVGVSREIPLSDRVLKAPVYLNHQKSQKKEIQKSFTDKHSFKKIPVDFLLKIALNEPLQVQISDGKNIICLKSDSPLSLAQNRALTEDFLREEFSALGGTVFLGRHFEFQWGSDSGLFLSHKEIKQLRQRLTESLAEQRQSSTIDGFQTELKSAAEMEKWLQVSSLPADSSATGAPVGQSQVALSDRGQLSVLLRNKAQVDDVVSAVKSGVLNSDFLRAVILDFEFGRDYRGSLEELRAVGLKAGLATTRILKPQEYQNLKNLKSLSPDIILVRNLGAIEYYKNENPFGGELWGDFSLNVTNHLSSEYLLARGLSSLCLSYDLNSRQIDALLENSASVQNLEITIHQTMPSFHMEHCVFAAFLSQGSSYRDCGKPCEKHHVELQDQFGHKHWIKADQECRNTMFNAKAQTALRYFPTWQSLGLRRLRYEALHEKGPELVSKIQKYLQYLEGRVSLAETLAGLGTLESYGLSEGNLARTEEYQSRKKDFHFQQ